MLKQLLISLLVLVAAAAAYVYFVPGADATLAGFGITLPPHPVSGEAQVATVGPAATAPGGAAAGANRPGGAPPAGQGSGAAAGGGRPGAPGGAPGGGRAQTPTVITAPVTTSTINDQLTAIGQGVAAQSVSVTSQATGTLVKILVAPGGHVKAGDVIAQLDSDAEQIASDKATLAVKDAADTLQRTQTLAKTNAATTVALAAAQLASDNATLELRNARLALDKRSIVTPIDGTVGLFQVTAGNAVGAQTVVTTVDDSSSILVNYWVPERLAPVLKVGMPVAAVAIALPDRSFDGTVSAVDSRIDITSRTLQVQATLPNGAGNITPGMSFEVSMKFPGDKYPAVDPLAIQWGADGSYVWLLGDSKVKKDKVEIIERNSDGVLVKGALKPGDQVVTQGVLQLADGGTVRQLDAGPTGGSGQGGKPGAAPAAGASGPSGASAANPAGTPGGTTGGAGRPSKAGVGDTAPAATPTGSAPASAAAPG